MASSWHPAYLVHGDAHGRIGERRGNLRRKAEAEDGSSCVETYEGDQATPEAVAAALCAMTFALGRRFVVVDGVEKWKADEVKAHLAPVLASMPDGTTVAFFGRDEGKAQTPSQLADLVKAAGGVVAREETPKAKDLPKWLVEEARKQGIAIDLQAARLLVEQVGDRQQRLLREVEKLGLEYGLDGRLGLEEVESAGARSAERQAWGFVDALVARDRVGATRAYLELRGQGEALPRLVPLLVRRVRDVLAIAARIEAGESPAEIKGTLRMSPYAADRRIKEARAADPDALRRALIALADLELASRGLADVGEDTAALQMIDRVAA
jgi:DNA polymerase-3 subunit delta